MTTYPMHFTDNANSWQRMWLLAKLYMPGFKWGLIICAIVPALVCLLTAMVQSIAGHVSDVLLQWPLTLLLYLSPIMLTRRDYRDISHQLPVTAAEKLGFLLITFWIVVPAIVVISSMAGEGLSVLCFGKGVSEFFEADQLKQLETFSLIGLNSSIPAIILINCVSIYSISGIIIYYVVTAKKNKVLAAVVSLLCILMAIMIFSAIGGIVLGVTHGYICASEGLSDAEIAKAFMEGMKWVAMALYGMLCIACILYLIKLYKYLRNSGF